MRFQRRQTAYKRLRIRRGAHNEIHATTRRNVHTADLTNRKGENFLKFVFAIIIQHLFFIIIFENVIILYIINRSITICLPIITKKLLSETDF